MPVQTRMLLGSDQSGFRVLVVEWNMETGVADVVDEATHPDIAARLRLRSGSFTEIADQMRSVTDWAKRRGWITADEVQYNKSLITRSLYRHVEQLRVVRIDR